MCQEPKTLQELTVLQVVAVVMLPSLRPKLRYILFLWTWVERNQSLVQEPNSYFHLWTTGNTNILATTFGKKAGRTFSCVFTGRFLHWASPKKLEYGKPRLGESTLT